MPSDVAIEVIEADALRTDADVLVLKHAQESVGLDAAVKELLDLDQAMSLPPGEHLMLNGPPAVSAAKVIFLGVPPLPTFGYIEIRLFARRAMALVGQELPEAREVALTLHGAGYGLDEIACLDAELAGLFDALELKTAPEGLRRILILERDARRAERLQRHMDKRPADSGRDVSAATLAKDHAFVAMPFSDDFYDVYHYAIERSIHANGLLCERVDQSVFTGGLLDRMQRKIRSAKLVVADLTGGNPNVYLEVGFAWACEVPTVLVRKHGSELMFDVQGHRCLSYTRIHELEKLLTAQLGELLATR